MLAELHPGLPFDVFAMLSMGAGAAVETLKKQSGGGGQNLAKLENETEVFAHEHVSSELKRQIQQARLAKKLTQSQLAQLINEKPQIINEYENGKAIPNPQVRPAAVCSALLSREERDGWGPAADQQSPAVAHIGRWHSDRSALCCFSQVLSKMSRVLGVTLKKNPKK